MLEKKITEAQLHQQCVLWLHNELPHLRGLWWHTPNGEFRDKKTAAKLAGMGVLPGVPDFIFINKGTIFCVELKNEKGRLTEAQKQLHLLWDEYGIEIYIVRSLSEFKRIVGEKYKLTIS